MVPSYDHSWWWVLIRCHQLLYLTISCPKITFSVGVCVCYQFNSKISHLTQVKRIIKYISGTSNYGLLYCIYTNSYLVRYCDANWESNIEDRKSTSGGCFFLENNLIYWFSNKQNCVSFSTTQTEYITISSSCT